MGQKRIQNVIDDKIGSHLAKFETELMRRVDRDITRELEQINTQHRIFQGRVKKAIVASNDVREVAEEFRKNIGWKLKLEAAGVGIAAGAVGGLLMFFLMWYAW